MDSLFPSERITVLRSDGEALLLPELIGAHEQQDYLQDLLDTVPWKSDVGTMYGKPYVTKRKTAWYGNKPYRYVYSGIAKTALPWTATLKVLKELVSHHCETDFNSCLLNLYHDGEEGMSWHSDDEASLQSDKAIASLSLGVERKFSFKHNVSKARIDLQLLGGSLLLMRPPIQEHWKHQLPKSKRIVEARINLTFRSVVE